MSGRVLKPFLWHRVQHFSSLLMITSGCSLISLFSEPKEETISAPWKIYRARGLVSGHPGALEASCDVSNFRLHKEP